MKTPEDPGMSEGRGGSATEMIATERRRQIEKEGFDTGRDDA